MAIDNIVQAPITEVSVSTTLDQEVIFDVDFEVTGIGSFKSNDHIKIDDEIMLIQNIGVGETNNFKVVRRKWERVLPPWQWIYCSTSWRKL